jgi:hypothetical protein
MFRRIASKRTRTFFTALLNSLSSLMRFPASAVFIRSHRAVTAARRRRRRWISLPLPRLGMLKLPSASGDCGAHARIPTAAISYPQTSLKTLHLSLAAAARRAHWRRQDPRPRRSCSSARARGMKRLRCGQLASRWFRRDDLPILREFPRRRREPLKEPDQR